MSLSCFCDVLFIYCCYGYDATVLIKSTFKLIILSRVSTGLHSLRRSHDRGVVVNLFIVVVLVTVVAGFVQWLHNCGIVVFLFIFVVIVTVLLDLLFLSLRGTGFVEYVILCCDPINQLVIQLSGGFNVYYFGCY